MLTVAAFQASLAFSVELWPSKTPHSPTRILASALQVHLGGERGSEGHSRSDSEPRTQPRTPAKSRVRDPPLQSGSFTEDQAKQRKA